MEKYLFGVLCLLIIFLIFYINRLENKVRKIGDLVQSLTNTNAKLKDNLKETMDRCYELTNVSKTLNNDVQNSLKITRTVNDQIVKLVDVNRTLAQINNNLLKSINNEGEQNE